MTLRRRLSSPQDMIVHILFAVLLGMAVVFSCERIFADAAHYLFSVVNYGTFNIEHGRFVLFFSQILPWTGVKLGLPLSAILLLYSIGHVLFFYSIYLYCRYKLGDHLAGIVLLLIQTLALEKGYFTPMFELYYAAGFLVLFSSILWYSELRTERNIVLIALCFILFTSHPVAVLMWAFVVVLHWVKFGRRDLNLYLLLAGALVLTFSVKIFFASEYETHKTLSFIDTLRHMPYDAAYLRGLAHFLLTHYWELFLLWILSLALLVYHRMYLTLGISLIAFAGMLVVINGAHYGFQHSRYQEQVYFPLTWIVVFPLWLAVQRDQVRYRRLAFIIICGIVILWKCLAICYEGANFSRRVEMMERQITHVKSLDAQKAVISEENIKHQTVIAPNWSYAIETMFISSVRGPEHTVTICTDTDMAYEDNASRLSDDQMLLRRWNIIHHASLNPRYFALPEAYYTLLNSRQPLPESLDTLVRAVGLTIPVDDLHMRSGNLTNVPVVITNTSSVPLYSHPDNQLRLSYHWMQDDEMIRWDGERTALEVDVQDSYTQTMDILAPETSGHYILVIDLVAEGRQWFGIDHVREVWVY